MGIFAGLDTEAYDRSYSDRDLLKRIIRYFQNERRLVLNVVGVVLIISLIDLSSPLIISNAVSSLENNREFGYLLIVVPAVFLIYISSWFGNYIRRRTTGRVVGNIVRKMREDAFGAAMSRDMSFYDEFQSGKIVSRITSDTQDFAQVIVLCTDLLSQLIVVVLLYVILITIEWHLALLLGIFIPLVMGSTILLRNIARSVSRQASRVVGEVNANIQESVAGISVAKNFRQESRLYSTFNTLNKRSFGIYLRRGAVLSVIFPLMNIWIGIGTGALLYFGAQSVQGAIIGFSAWYLFIRSLSNFWDPLGGIASFWSQFQSGLAAAERIFALIDAPNQVIQTGNEPVAALSGDIEFRGVRFQYSEQEVVLPNFDLHIRPSETVAFVGHTGAGKSSIAKLVARFYEYQGGELLIDGRDIRSLDLSQFRQHLGIVSQVPFLFSGTVMDNIRYAKPDASEAEVEAVARTIGNGEWVEMLPNGLLTNVGERGARLSMGQRQLVVLARVLLQRPEIFILDEATASIDPFTETQIQQALNLILSESTSILIAHRLSTVRSADRIIVLNNGEIIEQGSHDELMAAGGHYAELYDTYFRHQSLDYVEAAARMM